LKRAAGSAEVTPLEGINHLTGEVQSIMYLGDSEQYSLRLKDGTFVHAVEYNPTTRKADVGDQVVLQIAAIDIVVLPREERSD
jgi:ABC-type Fe3+/spermidine/putrescine transport system ATPase subunit